MLKAVPQSGWTKRVGIILHGQAWPLLLLILILILIIIIRIRTCIFILILIFINIIILSLSFHYCHHISLSSSQIIWLCLKIRSPNPMVLSVNFRQLDIIAWPYWRVHTIFRQRHIDAGYDNYESINCHSDRCFPSWLRRSSWRTETGQRKSLEVSPSTYGPFKIGWLIGFGIGSYTTKVIGDCDNPDSKRRTAGWFQVLGTFPYIYSYCAQHTNMFGILGLTTAQFRCTTTNTL